MTEQEWLTSKDPIAMLDWVMQLHFRPSDRKLRLAMCAMSRASAFDSFELMRRVSLAERWADGEIDREAVVASAPGESTFWRDWIVAHHIVRDAAEWTSQSYKWVAPHVLREVFGNPFQTVALPLGEKCQECAPRLRWQETWCRVCRNTEHGPSPVLTPLVLQLAEAAYTVRTGTGTLDNDALAVLSDALEEAGLPEVKCNGKCSKYRYPGRYTGDSVGFQWWTCPDCKGTGRQPNPILAHLRSPGPHYRGCWATDILLGKE